MAIERGSTWNKWDFHVHTPYSILHNDFGLGFVDGKVENFDYYVKKLFTKAVENGIVAIGITDYFSIEGYKRIRHEYLDNADKLLELFPECNIREKVLKMFIFPNIEFRLETFVGKKSHSVNYHVIFSDIVSTTDIEENFLHRLEIIHVNGQTLPLTNSNIERIGREFNESNHSNHNDFLAGLQKITVDYKNVIKILSNSTIFRKNYMISVPVDEDLSQIEWKGRDYQTRKNIYQQCDFFMTSNDRTREWALAKGHEQSFISEFGSLKPCIWGSDAHDYDSMFCPNNEKYCWIKAEPTFEGLRQIMYEPDTRVHIQKDCPDSRDAHHIIDYIAFNSDDFLSAPIYFNEGLNVIIGGKSTGKSILLRHIAKSIDAKQVFEREEKTVGASRSPFDVPAEVRWRYGVSGNRKIIYIPQSWLNRIVDEFHGDSQLNRMLENILLQQDDVKNAETKLKNKITEIIDEAKHNILDYVTAKTKVEKFEIQLKEDGRSDAFAATINTLEKQREALSSAAGLTDDMLKRYAELERTLLTKTEELEQIKNEEAVMDFQAPPFVYIPGLTELKNDIDYVYHLDVLKTSQKLMDDAICLMNSDVSRIWDSVIPRIQSTIENKKISLTQEIEHITDEIKPLKNKISQSDVLKKIDVQLQEEQSKYKRSKDIETNQSANIAIMEELKGKVLASRSAIAHEYEEYKKVISGIIIPDSNLLFTAGVENKRQELLEAINSLFHNKSIRPFREKYGYDFSNHDQLKLDECLFTSIWDAMEDGTLSFKGGNTIQSALERLFSDWMYIHFSVKSGNDEINNMSPGKKAIVLLEMIVNLESSKCPILIDQPEDDLDNRSIYVDLVQYLKKKKSERQIIVVTHNANIVIGADAEEIIIANQDGDESKNNSKRFEYRYGAIETITPSLDENNNVIFGVLYQKGIQQQICDILEGGIEAFELRQNKYHTNK